MANAGEDAIIALALKRRPGQTPKGYGTYLASRSPKQIRKYRNRQGSLRKKFGKKLKRGSMPSRKRARRAYRRKLTKLRTRYLYGRDKIACAGPRKGADRRWGKQVLAATIARERARKRARNIASRSRRRTALKRAERRYHRALVVATKRRPRLMKCPPMTSFRQSRSSGRSAGFPPPHIPPMSRRPPTANAWSGWPRRALPQARTRRRVDQAVAEGPGRRPGRARRHRNRGNDQTGRCGDRARQLREPPAGTPIVGENGGPSERSSTSSTSSRKTAHTTRSSAPIPAGRETRASVVRRQRSRRADRGITPNNHALSRKFSLMDHAFANSEESTAGHKITAGGYANDYSSGNSLHSKSRKEGQTGHLRDRQPRPVHLRPAVTRKCRIPGLWRIGAGNQPLANEGRPTFRAGRDRPRATRRRSRGHAGARSPTRPGPRIPSAARPTREMSA